ncbi:hypothetical protein [Brevundimonas intermedia]|uniref:hypothetical protein n=1 Tax=Brevundimonas intermedia TaxID=74315 RepID=UPI0032097C03
MNSTIAVIGLIIWAAISLTMIVVAPGPLSDDNGFLLGFVNHEFLSFMGVVVTITLASAANLFVEMNKLEDRHDREIFPEAKVDVRDSAYALVGALIASVVIVVAKPWLSPFGDRGETAANCAALAVMAFAIFIMIDLVQAAFNLDPRKLPNA